MQTDAIKILQNSDWLSAALWMGEPDVNKAPNIKNRKLR